MNVQSAAGVNPAVYTVSKRLNTDAARVVTISELYAESGFKEVLNSQIVGKDGKIADVSKLDIISPKKIDDWYTPEFSPNVENGIKYRKSCFDFTNSGEFAKLTAEEDFTGMSDAEIYKSIYEKYQYCYGKNFYYASAISYPIPPSEYDDYHKVIRRFNKEVSAALGGEEQVKAACREALYGDMSDYEVRESIIDKYDLSDGMTFRELYKLSFDMWEVGLDGGFHNRLDDLFYDFSTAESRANCDNIAAREKYLDTDVSGKYFNELQKFAKLNGILPEYSTTLNQIRAACGASSRGVSVSSVSTAAKNNFQWIKL